jgi:hypothetical protein
MVGGISTWEQARHEIEENQRKIDEINRILSESKLSKNK